MRVDPPIPAASAIRDRSSLALMCIVVGFAVANALGTWFFPKNSDFAVVVMFAAFVAQPMLFGMWTALGGGSILTRMPLAVPCLMLLFVAPGYVPAAFADTQRYEFITFVLAGFGIYVAALVVFLIFRFFTGFRILAQTDRPAVINNRLRFSINYLLILMTMYAITIAFTTQLKFDSNPPTSYFGSDFFVMIVVFASATLAICILPTMAVPLAILHGSIGRRPRNLATAFWAIVTAAVTMYFTFQSESFSTTIGAILLAQLSATIVGILAAVILRWGGLRLMRGAERAGASSPALIELAPSSK